MDQTRIADLKRRLQADPSSIAFAQLAEEYRRAGQFDEAVMVCRAGLARHQGYLSARITLGRALADLGHSADAAGEFEQVLQTAPDNLAAVRGVADIHHKRGELDQALTYYRRALTLAHYDPDLEDTVHALATTVGGAAAAPAAPGLSFEQARHELLAAPSRVPAARPAPPQVDFDSLLRSLGHDPEAPAPPIVEAWLSAEPRVSPVAPPPAAGPDLGTDLLARLETELRQLEQQPPPALRPAIAPPPAPPSIGAADHRAIAALERWLVAIAVRRRALASRT